MTDDEWFHEQRDLLHAASERRGMLFGVACCRRAWHLMTAPGLREIVGATECRADGLIHDAEYDAAMDAVIPLVANLPDGRRYEWDVIHYMIGVARNQGTRSNVADSASYVRRGFARMAGREGSSAWAIAVDDEGAIQRKIYDDIFDNSFQPISLSASWRTSTVLALADGMYRSRDFAAMPVLADALQDAGCDDGAVLAHCRNPEQVHVRGCWVVDLVLGKS